MTCRFLREQFIHHLTIGETKRGSLKPISVSFQASYDRKVPIGGDPKRLRQYGGLEDLGDVDIALGPHFEEVLVRCQHLQDFLVLQGTTKSTRKKSQENSMADLEKRLEVCVLFFSKVLVYVYV